MSHFTSNCCSSVDLPRLGLPKVDPTAILDATVLVSEPPEDRSWKPGKLAWGPDIGPGARLNAYVTVDCGVRRRTRVGARSLLMKKVHVGHDAQVGCDVSIAPNSTVEGYAEIGDRAKLGSNVSVLPYRKVGADAVVGSGSVVTRDVPAGEVWCGNPARFLRRVDEPTVPYSERPR